MQLQRSFQVALVILTVLVGQNALADDAGMQPSQNQFWAKIRGLVQHCSVQTYTIENGKKVYGPLRSDCAEVQVYGSQARFNLEGKWYSATIEDSVDADGGDLNDVYVYNDGEEGGKAVAERHDTLAFGDILVGLAGGQVQLPQQYVRDLQDASQN